LATIANSLFTLYSWTVVCGLIFFLFLIGRFYQQKAGKTSYYPVYTIPIALFAVAAVIYAWPSAGDIAIFLAGFLRFTAGLILIIAGRFLLKLMIGK
jgi:hypothetical protein